MSFPKYGAYVDSGVEWLGELPAHWGCARFKWEIERNDGGVWGDDPDGENDTVVLRSTEQTVDGRWLIEDPATRKLTDSDRVSSLLLEGDLVVTKASGSALHIGKTTIVTPDVASMGCCFSNFMQRVRVKESYSPLLAWYFMNNVLARVQFDLMSSSTTGLANLNGTIIGDIMLPVPPPEEQAAIADFLDRETAKIDALIAEQERLIALLKEKLQAVISHAVTRGLDPNASMKDSGVEWLGQVPAHWDVMPLGRMCKYISYGFTNPMPVADDGPIMLTANDVDYGSVRYESARRTTEEAFRELLTDKSRPVAGDLLLTKDGTLGRVAIHDGTLACINQSVAVLRPDTDVATSRFFCWVLLGGLYQERMIYEAGGTTIKHIYISRLAKMPLGVPPASEQEAISDSLEEVVGEHARLISAAELAVALLNERRSALISAAVTGKIDVHNVASASAEAA